MRRPWQIWLVFMICLAAVIPAMTWLSWKTMQIDSLRETDRVETEIARQEAELQERISSALYRMDLKLLPLVAQEAARPHYLYDSFYQFTNPVIDPTQQIDEGLTEVPSPLLFQPPEFVALHFQIGPDNKITSPQRPTGERCQLAITCCGITQASLDANSIKLQEVAQFCSYEAMLAKCPQVMLPQIAINPEAQQGAQSELSVYNVPAVEKMRKQINDSQVDRDLSKQQKKRIPLPNKSQLQQIRSEDRDYAEFNRRRDSTKVFAGQQWAMNNTYDNQMALGNFDPQTLSNLNLSVKPGIIREGVMQPMWVDNHLILARRVDGKEKPIIQCCWLDWEAIQKSLKAEVADLLTQIEFQPVKENNELILGTALTTIPVQLVVDSSKILSTLAIESGDSFKSTSGLKMSLLVAWCGLGLAALASALLLHGVMRLSERRATFVSAVTHELRTPLTTFRMYAEMLAEKMVPDDKQQEYANTLKVQADRLTHLVENVLQFARLERGATSGSNETLMIEDLFDRFSSRLVERANQAEMKLSIDIDDSISNLQFKTQPSTIEQVLFNLVDNACKYALPSSNNQIEISCRRRGRVLQFSVRDYGPGVATKYKKRMFQPFCKSDQDAANTAEGVGLGLALCCRMAASLGGRLYHEDCDDGASFVLEIAV